MIKPPEILVNKVVMYKISQLLCFVSININSVNLYDDVDEVGD